MGLEQYYKELLDKERRCSAQTFASRATEISEAHQKIADLEALFALSYGRHEGFVFQSLLHDLGMSLYHAVVGLYRQSYVSQRVVLENAIGALFYSAQLLRLRRWAAGEEDVSWRRVAFGDDGVFTESYFQAFLAGAIEQREEYSAKADAAYSRLSDFVHKNVKVHHLDEHSFTYNDQTLIDVLSSLEEIIEIIAFAFCARYLFEVKEETRENCSQAVEALVGHVPQFQALIGGQVE